LYDITLLTEEMKHKTKITLVLIFLLALFFRFWKLDIYPEAIDEDEMALGYYAYSLVHDGTDEYGHKFPIYFESAGDYKYGLYSYLDSVPVFLFGLNPIATRSVSAVAGSLSVIAIFFLAFEILKNEEYGIISAFVLAVNPVHIHFSRVAYPNILGALFAVVSITLYLRWIRRNNFGNLIFSFFTFVVAIYSYQAYRIFLPIVFIFLPIFLYKSLGKLKYKAIIFSVLVVVSVGLSFIPSVSRARSSQTSSLINMPMLTEQISEDGLAKIPPTFARVFDNKITVFVLGYTARYFAYFNPNFLFVATTGGTERHSIPNLGLFYLIEAPLFLLGLLYLFKVVNNGKKFIPLVIILASPIAAATIDSSVSTTRAVILIYGITLIVALGAFVFLTLNKKFHTLLLIALLAIYSVCILYFLEAYTVHKIYHHPWYSDVGLKEVVLDVDRLQDNYKNVVIQGGHYISFLFYNQTLPGEFIKNSTFNDLAQANGVRVKTFGKLVFNMPDCPNAGKIHVLYICFGYKVPVASKLIDVIRYRDGQPAILIVEFVGVRKTPEKLPERVEYSKEIDNRFLDGLLPENYATFWPTQ